MFAAGWASFEPLHPTKKGDAHRNNKVLYSSTFAISPSAIPLNRSQLAPSIATDIDRTDPSAFAMLMTPVCMLLNRIGPGN